MDSGPSSAEISSELKNTDYTAGELFEGSVFRIPHYQRFYSWERAEWLDFWQDLFNIIGKERKHYMGTVICKAEQNPVLTQDEIPDFRAYGIVDGQQRFTTLVLLIRAIESIYRDIPSEELSEEKEDIYDNIQIESSWRRFVSDSRIERTATENRFKLHLQDDDDDIFRSVLREDIDETAIETPSQGRIVDAYRFYQNKLESRKEELPIDGFLKEIDTFLSTIESLRFIAYTVDDPEEATLIFESVNDRGIGLSKLDKTKSFLMHKVYLAEPGDSRPVVSIDAVQERFGRIYRWMQDISETDRVSDIGEEQIQRYHYIANIDRSVNSNYVRSETNRRNRTLRSGATVYLGALKWHFTNLQEGSRPELYGGHSRGCLEEIEEYTDSLTRYYSHMESIGSYGTSGEYDSAIDWEFKKIFALDRLGNFYPLLLTVWDEFTEGFISEGELHEILQLIEIASFRIYTTVSRSDTGRGRFYKLANKIATGERSADWIIDSLKDDIQSKANDFEALLRDQNAYQRIRYKDLRYLLISYELYLRYDGKGGGEINVQKAAENAGNEYTLDHIWPRDTGKLGLSEEQEEVHEEIKDSLGNLTLTTGPRNSAWKNRPYHEKRKLVDEDESGYWDSDFTMTRKVARDYEEWGEDQIEKRLDDIIDFAKQRWGLDATQREPKANIRPPEVE